MSTTAITQPIDTSKPAVAEYPFLLISPKKLAVMSILTLNLYNFYWLYKNWKAVNEAENTNLRSGLRAVFNLIFIRSLFLRMGLKEQQLILSLVIYGLAVFSSRLPGPWSLICVFNFVPLMMAQQSVNAEHSAEEIVTSYSTKEKIFAVIGALMWPFVLISFTLPAQG
jgi:hypothetical protein